MDETEGREEIVSKGQKKTKEKDIMHRRRRDNGIGRENAGREIQNKCDETNTKRSGKEEMVKRNVTKRREDRKKCNELSILEMIRILRGENRQM